MERGKVWISLFKHSHFAESLPSPQAYTVDNMGIKVYNEGRETTTKWYTYHAFL